MKSGFIEIKKVSHTYQTQTGPLPVLSELSLSILKDSFTAFVGPSGCGKSTLTRLVAGLLKPDAGTVWLGGEKVDVPRAKVGMAFQNPVSLEWRTILQNVMLPLEIVRNSFSIRQKKERATQLLSLVGLSGFEDKRPSELSGGMRQRAHCVGRLFTNLKYLFLMSPLAHQMRLP